jgi:hypothetical protein
MNFKFSFLQRRCRVIGNEKGFVLVVGMLLITVLTMIALAGNNNALIDTTIASNNLSATRSFYLAESGLERGKLECVQLYLAGGWTSFDYILRGTDAVLGTPDDGILAFGNSVSFHGGTYAVKVTNDPNDGTSDTNSVVRITSTGTFGGATTKLQMQLSMTIMANVPGALTIVGETNTSFDSGSGYAFSIDGRDYNLADADGSPTGTFTKPGIAVGDLSPWAVQTTTGAAITAVKGSLTSIEQAWIYGTGYSASPVASSIAGQTDVTKSNLRALADSFRAVADNKISYPTNFSGQTDPSGNISNWPSMGQFTCLGTTTNPKITYIDATDNSIINTGISFTGTGTGITGAGVLVIEGNELKFNGKINWTGLVIVVGDFGSFSAGSTNRNSTDNIKIRGGLMVGEYLTDSSHDKVYINTNTKIQYSKQAVDMVNNLLGAKPPYSVSGWQRAY